LRGCGEKGRSEHSLVTLLGQRGGKPEKKATKEVQKDGQKLLGTYDLTKGNRRLFFQDVGNVGEKNERREKVTPWRISVATRIEKNVRKRKDGGREVLGERSH